MSLRTADLIHFRNDKEIAIIVESNDKRVALFDPLFTYSCSAAVGESFLIMLGWWKFRMSLHRISLRVEVSFKFKVFKKTGKGCDVDEIWYDRCSGTKPVIGFDIFPELCSFCKSEAKTYLKWKKGRDPWQSSKISECNSYRFCVSATPTHPRILDNGDRTFMSIVDKTAYDRQVDRWTNDR